jgi:hypothetical protein
MVANIATVDALVIGPNTYEVVLGLDPWPYGPKPIFVLSSQPLAPAPIGAVLERVSGPPARILSELAARGIQHVYVAMADSPSSRFFAPG